MRKSSMSSHDYELTQLAKILERLEVLDPLPKVGSKEALADHNGWTKRFDGVREIVREAEYAALLSIPSEVRVALDKVRDRERILLNLRSFQEILEQTQDHQK